MRRISLVVAAALLGACGWGYQASAAIVYSNGPAPGDDFTNATGSNTTPLTPGAALGSSGWAYNNVRNNGHVGIRDDNPRSGNGSVWMQGTQGPGGASSKADIEYFSLSGANLVAMGTLGDITTLAYDWYKNSTSAATQHTALRLYVDADGNLNTTNDRGYLVYERAYQTDNSVPTDQWVTDNVLSANLWQVAFGAGNHDTAGNWQPLSVWGSASGYTPTDGGWHFDANSVIYGLSAGIGSGWGTYEGYIDNIAIAFNDEVATPFNFEVSNVPEPGSLLVWSLLGLCFGGATWWKRRQSSR